MSPDPRPVVLIDVDEVLFPFAHAYDEWLVRERGWGLDEALARDYRIAEAAGPGHLEYAAAFVNDPATIAQVAPVPGAGEAISMLAPRFRLVACTTRRRLHESAGTHAWLKFHLGIEEAVFTRDDHLGPSIAKGAIAAAQGAVALVDDSVENLVDLPPTCRGILLRRPDGLASAAGSVTWAEAAPALLG